MFIQVHLIENVDWNSIVDVVTMATCLLSLVSCLVPPNLIDVSRFTGSTGPAQRRPRCGVAT